MLENRPKYNHHIFSSKILCGSCGTYYGPKTWHSNTKYRRTIWRCNKKYTKKEEPCKTPHLYEENIKKAFIDSVNELIANKEHILEDLKMVEDIFDTSQLQVSLELSIDKMNACKAKIEKLIEDNSKTSQDQIEYAKKYEKLVNAFNDEKENYERLAKEISEKESRKLKYDFFIEKLNLLEPLEEFDPLLWNLMLEKMVVHEDGSFEFKYANGI
ncbi:MAG: zinc ribbon domain-containing protein [Peptoniphilaceae bacterium]|nr:zinc ribbon domain-containing protein [Peptoniphilaceae bacterium]